MMPDVSCWRGPATTDALAEGTHAAEGTPGRGDRRRREGSWRSVRPDGRGAAPGVSALGAGGPVDKPV
jgi:hypothetical protein